MLIAIETWIMPPMIPHIQPALMVIGAMQVENRVASNTPGSLSFQAEIKDRMTMPMIGKQMER